MGRGSAVRVTSGTVESGRTPRFSETEYHQDMHQTVGPAHLPEAALTAMDRGGFRLTGPRRAVATIIGRRTGPFTAAEIEHAAKSQPPPVGRATIFRTIDVLLELGVIERLDLPSGEHAYVACEPAHHHHVVCSRCGRTADVDDAGLAAVTKEIARRTGFRIDTHRLELFGVCPSCSDPARGIVEP